MFKENFVKLCAAKGVSPSSVCRAVGLNPATYSQWTETSVPRRPTLIKIAAQLGVTVEDLVNDDADKINYPLYKLRWLDMSIFNKIDIMLKKRNINQKSLCEHLGISTSVFSDWKHGRNRSFMNYLPQIANFFNVSTDYLINNDLDNYNIDIPSADVTEYEIIGTVTAGYNGIAVEEYTGDKLVVPSAYLHGHDKKGQKK